MPPPPPVAPQRPVTDDYFGTKIVDPYRWMEDAKSAEFQTWLKAQGEYTRAVLDAVPHHDDIAKAIASDFSANPNRLQKVVAAGSRIFTLRKLSGKDGAVLFVRDTPSGADRVLIDPNNGDGHRHELLRPVPSWNGNFVAYAIQSDGNEAGAIRIIDVRTGKDVGSGGPVITDPVFAWLPDDSAVTYLRPTSRVAHAPSRLAVHLLGTPFEGDRDRLGFGVPGNPVFAERERAELVMSPSSPYVVVGIATSSSGKRRFYVGPWRDLLNDANHWRAVAGIDDDVTSVVPHANDLYCVSRNRAPNYRVLRTSAQNPNLVGADVVVPESAAVLQGPGEVHAAGFNVLSEARDALYVTLLDAGANAILRVPWNDPASATRIALPYAAGITDRTAQSTTDGYIFSVNGWIHAGDNFRYDPKTGRVGATGLQPQVAQDNPPGLVVEDLFVTARDGVKVPLTVIRRADVALDGTAPTILYGYAAYGDALTPFLDPSQLEWYRLGGIVTIVHARGGGEFGEAWHQAGKGATKPNTWHDAVDAAEYLVANHYTSPAKLAIFAQSAGGILAGRAITDRPDLFAAALIGVPDVDTLRFETQGVGPANRDEFGSVATESGFRALYEMSTYEHTRLGVRYPAILFTTGLNDRRMPPWEPAKAYARFVAVSGTRRKPTTLLRVDSAGGHFAGGLGEIADLYAFLMWQLGMPGYQPSGH